MLDIDLHPWPLHRYFFFDEADLAEDVAHLLVADLFFFEGAMIFVGTFTGLLSAKFSAESFFFFFFF